MCKNKKVTRSKSFKTEMEAACEYNKMALKIHGERAKLNETVGIGDNYRLQLRIVSS